MLCVSDLFHIPHTIISCVSTHCNRKSPFNLRLGFSLHALALHLKTIHMEKSTKQILWFLFYCRKEIICPPY